MQGLGKDLGITCVIRGSPDLYVAFPGQLSHRWNRLETLLGCAQEEQQRLSREQQDPGENVSDLRFTWKIWGEGGQENGKEAKRSPTGCEVKVSKCKLSLYTQCCFLSWFSHTQNRSHVQFE